MKLTLTNFTNDPISAIEKAAANSYDSKIKQPGKIMQHCYSSGHLTPFEFADFTFHVEGISRACMAQLTRYRMASFNIRSQRHCIEDGIDYVIPPTIKSDAELLADYQAVQALIEAAYKSFINLGVPVEDARYLLSNATPTILEFKMNLRELIHFCNQRLCMRSQWEIRDLAQKVRDCVLAVMPDAKPFLVPQCEAHSECPFCTEEKSCGKHPKLKEVYTVNGENNVL